MIVKNNTEQMNSTDVISSEIMLVSEMTDFEQVSKYLPSTWLLI